MFSGRGKPYAVTCCLTVWVWGDRVAPCTSLFRRRPNGLSSESLQSRVTVGSIETRPHEERKRFAGYALLPLFILPPILD